MLNVGARPPLPSPTGNLFGSKRIIHIYIYMDAGALVQPSDGVDKHLRPHVQHATVFQYAGAGGSFLQEEGLEVRGGISTVVRRVQ